jgi:hypothetical protein
MADGNTEATAPSPGQTVAAATTKTDEPQVHARNIRSTDWLAPGEAQPPPGQAKTPASELEECLTADESQAPWEHMLSEARAIQESLVRLGPGATPEEVRGDLARFGIRVSVDDVKRVIACTTAPRAVPAPTDPAKLVRTEGDSVPPPRGGPTP